MMGKGLHPSRRKHARATLDALAELASADVPDLNRQLRSLFDAYHCYSIGGDLLSSNDAPRWLNSPNVTSPTTRLALRELVYWSKDAKKAMASEDEEEKLAVDHAVPLTVITEKIRETVRSNGKITARQLKKMHKDFYIRILITADEHKCLNNLDKQQNYSSGTDWRKRYKRAKIAVVAAVRTKN